MSKLSRRSFLKSSSGIALSAALIPQFISCSPNNRLNFAVIGVGNRGKASWSKLPVESIVAMCDVDDRMTALAYETVPHAKKYKDFRKMFDEMHKEIDAVIVATPDHTHFPAAMAAMELGKHVLVEKPLAHNIWQLRTLKKAAHHYGVVTQMANQGHTTSGIRSIKEYYEAGILGEVREVVAWQSAINWEKDGYFGKPNTYPPKIDNVPKELDWDLWVGPAKMRSYNNLYAPKTWRSFYDFGNGKLGDWCCHTLDAPYWSLDLGQPTTVKSECINAAPEHMHSPTESCVEWEFAARGEKAPVKMKWLEGFEKPELRPEWGLDKLPHSGMIMIGDKNTLFTGPRPDKFRLLMPNEDWKEFLKTKAPEQTYERVTENQPVKEWIDCIKNGTLPGSNFDYATELMEACQVGVLAQRFGGTINWDAKNMKAIGRPELDRYIKEPVRDGWNYGKGLI